MEYNRKVLQYGDIIKIFAPSNAIYNNKTFVIDYIDFNEIQISDLQSRYIIKLIDDVFQDESIINVTLIAAVPQYKRGYALLNGLLPKKWIDIIFDSDFPNLTGLIKTTQTDVIEVQLWSNKSQKITQEIIFIDFEYKGLPPSYHIQKIFLREKPE
jgi:hypothetical protein